LRNMKRRLEEIGGECQIESAPARGTTVTLQLLFPPKPNNPHA
jgi:signal transduction histidine kinase